MTTAPELVGIPPLDRLLATIPPRSTLVFVNDPGVAAEAFLYQTAQRHLEEGGSVVYAVLNRPPSSIQRDMLEYGFDPLGAGHRLHFVDAFSPLIGGSEGAPYEVAEARDLTEFLDELERAATEHPDATLVLDSLSTLLDHSHPSAFREHLPRLHGIMRRFQLTVALFTRWPYGEDVDTLLAGFDGQVAIRSVEDRIVVSQYFVVERAAWRATPERRPLLYRTVKPGGVLVYIPKIVITGPYHAGKTTFVHTLSDVAVSVNRLGTTIAMDHGQVTLDGLTADIFGTPGQSRFDPLLKTLTGQALGIILLVDSTLPDTLPRAREMIDLTWRKGIPLIVAANKQDAPGALTPSQIERLLDPPPGVRVVGTIGCERDSARAVLRDLLDRILGLEVPA